MLRKTGLVAFLVAQSFCGAAAHGQTEAVTLTPLNSWNLDYSEDSCALRRGFSDGTSSVFLEMRQFAPEGEFRFTVYSNEMEPHQGDVEYLLHPEDQPRFASSVLSIAIGESGRGVIFDGGLGFRPESPDQNVALTSEQIAAWESRIVGISLLNAFEQPVRLETGSMHEPLNAMRQCMDELLTHWNIDVAAHRTLKRRAEPVRYERLLRQMWHSYPAREAGGGYQAALRLRLIIGTNGRVAECHVQTGIGLEAFSDSACLTLRQYGRFEPALDANGEPIRSYWTTSVSYIQD